MSHPFHQDIPTQQEEVIAAFILRLDSLRSALSGHRCQRIPDFDSNELSDTLSSILNLLNDLSQNCLNPALCALPARPIRVWQAELKNTLSHARSRKILRGRLATELQFIAKNSDAVGELIQDEESRNHFFNLVSVTQQLGKPLRLKAGHSFSSCNEKFKEAVTDVLTVNWSRFPPIPHGSWRSFPSAILNILKAQRGSISEKPAQAKRPFKPIAA